MERIRVLAADDHQIVRDGLRELFNKQPDMVMVAVAKDGEEAIETTKALHPDVLLADIGMPGINGLRVISQVREISPRTQVVVFSMYKRDAYVQQALASGALGYVLKSSPSSEILDAVRTVHKGQYFLSSSIESEIINQYIIKPRKKRSAASAYDLLSEREQGVFRLMVEGKSIKEMAEHLCLSPKTVEKHRSKVMNKLGFHSLVDMMKYAMKIGIIDIDPWEG